MTTEWRASAGVENRQRDIGVLRDTTGTRMPSVGSAALRAI
jgi:hypothetical protein